MWKKTETYLREPWRWMITDRRRIGYARKMSFPVCHTSINDLDYPISKSGFFSHGQCLGCHEIWWIIRLQVNTQLNIFFWTRLPLAVKHPLIVSQYSVSFFMRDTLTTHTSNHIQTLALSAMMPISQPQLLPMGGLVCESRAFSVLSIPLNHRKSISR